MSTFTELFNRLMNESSIDFPQKGLCPEIWDDQNNLKSDVKEKIQNTLSKFNEDGFKLIKFIASIRIVGSICSNRWTDDSDLDVHLSLDLKNAPRFRMSQESMQKWIQQWFNQNRDNIDGWFNKHPIEVYWQTNYFQDLASDGVYDLTTDKWLVGPRIVDKSFDPYETFSQVHSDLKKTFDEIDLEIGELKRDVIDYDVIEKAIKNASPEQHEKLSIKLKQKLAEVEKDIETLSLKKKEVADSRKTASQPNSELDAAKMRDDKTWNDKNASFKFIARYGYLELITKLQKLIDDGKLEKKMKEVQNSLKGN